MVSHTHACMHACMHTPMHACTHAHTHTHVCMHAHTHSVASRLRNCGNPVKYIYWLHKWRASTPVYLQKMRMGWIFQEPMQPFFLLFFFFFFFFGTITRHYLWLFMIGHLLAAWPIIAIVLGKAAIFHRELGRRTCNCEVNFFKFQLQFNKEAEKNLEQKSKRMRKRWC